MGKRSSKEAKTRHHEKYLTRRILLEFSLHDRLVKEIVYTPDNAVLVKQHLATELGFTQNLADDGEVLVGPCGESPTLAAITNMEDKWDV